MQRGTEDLARRLVALPTGMDELLASRLTSLSAADNIPPSGYRSTLQIQQVRIQI